MDFRILGPLEVREGGRALELGGARQRALLALLLLSANEVVSSDRLLDELWAFCTRPQFVWIQRWKQGDAVLWDNRCVLHRRDPFDPGLRRLMHRTQIKGSTPY